MATTPEHLQTESDRKAEAHLSQMRKDLRQELNWDAQEARWAQQARHDFWQRWFWVGVVVLAALGIIFR